MDEQELMTFLANFIGKGEQDMGEGDYKDFLANYMHALNMGADSEQIHAMMSGISPERNRAMQDYSGVPDSGFNLEHNKSIGEARSGLNGLLRGR